MQKSEESLRKMKKLKCWIRDEGTDGWYHKNDEDLIVSVMKAPGDKVASLIMGKGGGKETTTKTSREAHKKAYAFMKKRDKC